MNHNIQYTPQLPLIDLGFFCLFVFKSWLVGAVLHTFVLEDFVFR